MLVTFLVIAGVEITIAATKHTELAFAVIVIGLGFLARALHKDSKIKSPAPVTGLARRVFNAQLFVLLVREVFTTIPVPVIEAEDEEAQAVFQAVRSLAGNVEVTTILDNAAIAGVDLLILGHSRRGTLTRVLRGDLLQQVSTHLPEEIQLVIVG